MSWKFLIAALWMPCLSYSQKIEKMVDPYNHQTRIFVSQVKLKPTVFISYRTIDSTIYLYIEGWKEAVGMINQNDIAIFVTEKDSVIIHATGTQDYHDRGKGDYRHEYTLSEDGLSKLSSNPLKEIIRYSTSGISHIIIPEKNQRILMTISAALLKEFQDKNKVSAK